ncbi:SDR family NAD(P)-dependent oxidoreductase [Nocardioides sp. cx-173]|uniref:SDR family NAD(P)-dependent oxidoreductase n=1 Tax=Nocardioides sp. cx-173 TaxID=2898796 RepID=UPI001E5DD6D6|nr:SDR family NAD(P)-dependent oxidoreductase [Nocardioides sp. cx-173]MCD4523560.1 SDR family oxidoreductase [Nocardioides sp. cx-173]UGB42103.1 SDR family oxidoreductase [Nocardioides sp. cx-173]
MSSRFTARTVLVTGATGALGEALARAFHAEGAHVVVAARDRVAGERLARDLGARANAVGLDVTSEEQWQAAVRHAEEVAGPVSVLVNNAANLQVGTVESVPVDAWRAVIDTNLTGSFLGIRAVVPSMVRAGAGSIVNISSIAGLHAAPGLVAYSASKWALRGLTRTAAAELARKSIRVNAVHPGIIDTPLAYDPATHQELVPVDGFAIPRQASTAEIAQYVLFVASEDAAFSTGSEFIADGGFALGPVA